MSGYGEGYKKVGHKARHGKRRFKSHRHGGHRAIGAVRDPIARAFAKDQRWRRRRSKDRLA